jgi:hypothetical protein
MIVVLELLLLLLLRVELLLLREARMRLAADPAAARCTLPSPGLPGLYITQYLCNAIENIALHKYFKDLKYRRFLRQPKDSGRIRVKFLRRNQVFGLAASIAILAALWLNS